MDLDYLPDILSLVVLIVGFRPLVRRVGAHVNLWFLGWGFLLVHYVALSFMGSSSAKGWGLSLLSVSALWGTELCALCFVVAAANMPAMHVGPVLTLELAVPVLLQGGLVFLPGPPRPGLALLTVGLFFLPALHMLFKKQDRSRSMILLSLVFGVFACAMLPLAVKRPGVVADGALAVLFLSAAYLYAAGSGRFSRGVVAAVAGLAGWGLTYPLMAVWQRAHAGVQPVRALVELPEYLMIAGIVLTLLEEHVRRTERLAMHDPLTDLPNRRLFEERLVATMEEARQMRTTIACLVIDVDNFKAVNDTLGHSAGDQLLRALAVRLAWHMSPRDILARTGGDEFTALLAGVNDENHLRFIASAMMSAASVPIMIDGVGVDVRISVGIALSPDDADDIESLRRMADEAMYAAKRRGGSVLAFAGEA